MFGVLFDYVAILFYTAFAWIVSEREREERWKMSRQAGTDLVPGKWASLVSVAG